MENFYSLAQEDTERASGRRHRQADRQLPMWAFVIIYPMTVNIEMPEIFKMRPEGE